MKERMMRVWMMALALQGCGILGEAKEGSNPGECSDAADNDADGLYDCHDDDCAGATACIGTDPSNIPPPGGTNTGAATGTNTGTPTGTNTGTPTGTNTGTPTGTSTGTNSSTPTGSNSGTTATTGTPTGTTGGTTSPTTGTTTGTATGTTTWVTTWTGSPVATVASLDGRTYEIDLAAGRWVQPAGVGALLGATFDLEIYLHVITATATTIDFRLAIGDGNGNQDMCVETVELPQADFSANPDFIASQSNLAMDLSGITLTIDGVEYSGAFRSSMDAIEIGRVTGELEMSQLTALVGADPCLLLAAFGVSCNPCATNPFADCVTVDVDAMTWPEVAIPVVVRTANDIAADPGCP